MEPFGVYLHVPFCTSRCDYCAFATWTDRHHLMDGYLDACLQQAEEVGVGMRPVTSVFVGGGTPNLVSPSRLMDVFEPLPLVEGAEFTVECNPDLVTLEQMQTYASRGVTRVSLGVQSMVPHVLDTLGRHHDPDNVRTAVEAVRAAGIERLNLDLIYGAVGESVADWQASVEGALELGPDHVSAYALTVEPGTPLADDPSRHPDDDVQADKYVVADELLTAAGLGNYEISNWARPGEECRHNLLYWRQGEYLGLGVAAHSHIAGRRFWSVRTPDRFIAAMADGLSTEAGSEELDPDDRELEGLQLAIRTHDGVPLDVVPDEVRHLVDVSDDGLARLTRDGRLLANEVAVRLTPRPSQ
ncbi:MAG: radical SAM family heme chaperone HemW [Actinomycetota bacterium]|nr:radical SAM family heme chaperone HemW [Actinomycetota bacterium]